MFWQLFLWIIFFILENFHLHITCASPDLVSNTSRLQEHVEIRIGFLVGSKRAKNDRSYSRPGRQLVYVFNYGVDKINHQFFDDTLQSKTNGTSTKIRFVPIVAETFGNENESIKQTVALITQHRVNFIVGPQETCQVESRLATVFNVAMISHYCPQFIGPNAEASAPPSAQQIPALPALTFIQTKPPHWKIVQRVTTLIGQLLSVHNGWYPQQLVLLYFREPINGRPSVDKRAATSWRPLNSSTSSSGFQSRWQDTYLSSDAIQYKLIGELLESELNQLFSAARVSAPNRKQRAAPITVLNWHTTFHYGFTKNPFRQLIQRHLLHQRLATNHSTGCNDFLTHRPAVVAPSTGGHHQQPTKAKRAAATDEALSHKPAIYVIVGHYYEHLGLMLALDELNLLGQQQPESSSSSPFEKPQSSVSPNHLQESLVVGVDIEQYDERDDSARFLRGLLLDEKGSRHQSSGSGMDSIAAMYRHYMGVVPAKPSRMAEFLEDMRLHYNQTSSSYSTSQPPHEAPERLHSAANQTTLDSIQLTMTRLFQFIRLPVEAFYLYDSLMLLGSYFHACVRGARKSLVECSEGNRAFEWFSNREYSSFIDHSLTRFDSRAQANGHYALIMRKVTASNDSGEPADDDFGLLPVGRFIDTDSGGHEIELSVEAEGIDPLWLAFWCHVRQSNITECIDLVNRTSRSTFAESVPLDWPTWSWLQVICSVALLIFLLYIIFRVLHPKFGDGISKVNHHAGWFSERDERNFLEIVQKFLLMPELQHQPSDEEPDNKVALEQKSLVELHCHMFPFPSCKFVHWLSALFQLKEMMFQYHSNLNNLERQSATKGVGQVKPWWGLIFRMIQLREERAPRALDSSTMGFFRLKHKGTASLRILLNKYKTINECFCNLSNLDNETIVKLHGASLSHIGRGGGKIVHLVVEQPDRGSLRDALRNLSETMDPEAAETRDFRELVVLNSISDLLKGLEYLHQSKAEFHGELKVTNCLLTSDWQLKLSGFHQFHMRRSLGQYEQRNSNSNSDTYYDDLIYSAPEVISNHQRRYSSNSDTLRLADFYAFAFVIYELIVGREPWSCLTQVTSSKLLVERVQQDSSFRPPISLLDSNDVATQCKRIDLSAVQRIIRSCWSQSPERRPQSANQLRDRLMVALKTTVGKDQVVRVYANLLERVSISRKNSLLQERQRSTELRLRLLPESVVSKMSHNQKVPVQQFDCVSLCMFRFVLASEEENPIELLNEILNDLDSLVESYRKRIHLLDSQVDSSLRHLVFSGEPLFNSRQNGSNSKRGPVYNHCQLVASFALHLIDLANRWQANSKRCIQVRCGLHCGPVLGGLILGGCGSNPHYDPLIIAESCRSNPYASSYFNSARYVLYGSTLQMADVLETSCMAQRIQLSGEFRLQIIQIPKKILSGDSIGDPNTRQGYVIIKREARVSSKIFGDFDAYWLLNGPRLSASQSIMLLSE